MTPLDLMKGKFISVKTEVGVDVILEIESVEEKHHSQDIGPSTRENDWYPESKEWITYIVTFTNGYSKIYNSLSVIKLI
jgi:hypothetical protein